MKANVKYKDTIFRMLYREKKNLLSLYNAMNGKDYKNPEELQVVTLENAIYMGMKNDLAFIIDMNLYLYEHQSTYNPNIPLRNLFYIADEYQKLVVQKSLYSSAIQKIPTPRFVVFYNGTRTVEDRSEFRLSSAYENPTEDPDLELRVTMFNINEGHNKELMEHCQTLREYAQYVARVRKYASKEELSLDEAVERAVDECIDEGILAEFLQQNKVEVVRVSIYEYDKEKEEKKLRQAEYEAGFESGKEAGFESGRKDVIISMHREGMDIEQISRIVGLGISEIQEMIENEV